MVQRATIDRRQSWLAGRPRRRRSAYKVCWSGPKADMTCWRRRTGSKNRPSMIFTAAPLNSGTNHVAWYVNHHAVTRWRFFNGVGD
jgi:hypothetical protein